MNDQMIRCFIEVVKTDSFSKAADNLFLSQQAVSKQVKHLEEELGYELLKRSTRHVEMTKIGEEFYQVFLKWQYDLESVKSKAERMNTEGQRLRIGLLERMNSGGVPGVVRSLKKQYPEYLFSISHDDPITLNEKILNDELDLIITYEDFLTEDVKEHTKSEYVGKTQLSLCLASDHPLAKEPFDRSKLASVPLLVCMDKGANKKEALERAMKERVKFGLGDGIVKLYTDINEVSTTVEMGEGFCFCSATNLFMKNPLIRTYPLEKITNVCAVWKKSRKVSLVKSFFETAKEQGNLKNLIF